jgi:TorA maturation chaperone TorD
MALKNETFSDSAMLATVCRLVGGLWLNELDRETLRLLMSAEVKSAWLELGGSAPPDDPDISNVLNRLAADYCQLLIGPKGHLPPVQSVWSDQAFQSAAASSVVRFYELYRDYQSPGSLKDHLGSQLDFAGFLIERADHDSNAAVVLAKFHEEHLVWSEPLLARVNHKAGTAFYRGLASVTGQLIKELTR